MPDSTSKSNSKAARRTREPADVGALLTEKLLRLSCEANIPGPVLTSVLEDVLPLLRQLARQGDWDGVANLASAAKALRQPARHLDFLRALAFTAKGSFLAAREALREELRYFPGNDEARRFLADLEPEATAQEGQILRLDPELAAILPVIRPYTMVAPAHLASLFALAKKACRLDLPGDFAECGVAAGGTSALLAHVIKHHSQRPRLLHCFDTFSGMPDPSARDTHAGQDANATGWGSGTCAAPEDSLRQVCRTLGVEDLIRPVKGLFKDTLPAMATPLALLHMDGDWYESTRDILTNLYDDLVPGGLVQVDDFGFWDGCRLALVEYFQENGPCPPLHPISGGGGIWFRRQAPANVEESARTP